MTNVTIFQGALEAGGIRKKENAIKYSHIISGPTWLLFLETELKFMTQTAPSSIMAA